MDTDRKLSFAERNPITPMRHSRYRKAPRLPAPDKRARIDWSQARHDLRTRRAGEWLLIGINMPSRIGGRPSHWRRMLDPDFCKHFNVEVYAHKLPPRHDDLPSGYNIYARKNPQKKEIGK